MAEGVGGCGGVGTETVEGCGLGLDSQAVEGHRQHLVVADDETQLEEFLIVELVGE